MNMNSRLVIYLALGIGMTGFGYCVATGLDLVGMSLFLVASALALVGAVETARPESRELVPESLEKTNFRVDSTNWKVEKLADGTRVKRNPEGDVTELLEGEFAGEQHFTLDAALRETAKASKRMPTKEEWGGIIRAINPRIDPEGGRQQDASIREILSLKLSGYRYASFTTQIDYGVYGYYWSSTHSGPHGDAFIISPLHVRPVGCTHREHGLSVRCFAD